MKPKPTPYTETLARMEAFISGYMSLPNPTWATLLALWAIGSWTYRVFDAFPYLVITAATKQAGKTRLMEILSLLCQKPIMTTDVTPAVVARRYAEAADTQSGVTLFIDEAEKLSKENHPLRAMLNVGYRRGQVWSRVYQNEIVDYPVYGPKVFSLIGDVFDTLRDRSIVITLERGKPARGFDYSTALAEAMAMKPSIVELAPYRGDKVVPDMFVGGREAEIWAPIFSLASVWCPEKRDALMAVAADLAALKTAPKRRYTESADDEAKIQDDAYAQRAVRDMAALMGDNRYLSTETVVADMRAIPAGPWRVYRGDGLTPILLSHLLSRFDIRPRQFKESKARNKVVRGYARADVNAALAKLG